jgi:hypothetical protein
MANPNPTKNHKGDTNMIKPKLTRHRTESRPAVPLRPRLGKPHILVITHAGHRTSLGGRAGFDYPVVQEGQTANFVVYYDPALGSDGQSCADGVLATCENEYAQTSAWFGGINSPTLPINVILAPLDPSGQGGGGAYHYGCAAVDLYCDVKNMPTLDIDFSRFLMEAELVEVFEAAQNVGWNCGFSNGEGLSRVLATALYPAELNGYTTAAAWLDTPDRPDWVNNTDTTDVDPVSNGCAVLFLNYLNTQLGYAWAQIVQAGAPTLAQTYTNLTGNPDGWTPFRQQLDANFPLGTPSGVTTDNPYPLP